MGDDVGVLGEGIDLGGRAVLGLGGRGGSEASGQDNSSSDRLGEHCDVVGYVKPRTEAKV